MTLKIKMGEIEFYEGKRSFFGNKRGQLTLFIILGIALLAVVFLLFFRTTNFGDLFLGKSPIEQIQSCMQDALQQGITLVEAQGGSVTPSLYYLYNDKKISYICYTEDSFEQCVMQNGILPTSIELSIKGFIQPKIETCLENVKKSLENEGNTVTHKKLNVSVSLAPGEVVSTINLDLVIEKNDARETYQTITSRLSSSLYELAIISGEIANSEATYGDSDITRLMYIHQDLKIEKIKQGDETKIYIITNRDNNEQFYFAIKSVAIPPGWIEVE